MEQSCVISFVYFRSFYFFIARFLDSFFISFLIFFFLVYGFLNRSYLSVGIHPSALHVKNMCISFAITVDIPPGTFLSIEVLKTAYSNHMSSQVSKCLPIS